MSIACYVRCSDQRGSLEKQRDEIEKWLANNGIDRRTVKWFYERKSSASGTRHQFDRLQGEILGGKINMVVLSSLERLSRSLLEGVRVLSDWCSRGLRIAVSDRDLEFGGDVGRTLSMLMPGLVEMDRAYRHERQMPGIERARTTGVYRGRKKGATKSKPESATELRDKGHSIEEIAQLLGVSTRTAWRYLKKTKE